MKNHLASAATLCLMIMCLLAHHTAFAAQSAFNEVQSGTLLLKELKHGSSHYTPATLVDTSVDITVSGMLTRTRLKQTFQNESPHWLEAVYVFPLPDSAGVDKLRMVIGEKVIEGVIQTREKARQTYQTAKQTGKKASLLEQQRGNLFTSRVANIPPGETINIEIEFQSVVRYLDGSFNLAFPLTITPRYIPGQRLQNQTSSTETESYNATSAGWASVPDADEITPPMVAAYDAPATSIVVNIEAGLPLESINSESHAISTEQTGDVWRVSLTGNTIAMDRDFLLSWHPALGQSPHAAIFRENRDDEQDSFASIMLVPPQDLFDTQSALREVIFVIDTSGSMQGNSIVQARQALQMGIERLTDQDTFNVIEFDDDTHRLFSQAVDATPGNRKQAISWVSGLSADGGTEIMAAMNAALSGQQSTTNRLRQVIFVTDGSVGNEDQIFQRIQKTIKNSRLFTIGIGSAPNTWFMRKAAELGRGSYTSISTQQDVSNKMLQLFNKLERPVLTNISLNWSGVSQPELYPATVPDLYAGEPVLADARWNKAIDKGELIISGAHGGQQWQRRLALNTNAAANQNNKGELHKRWAKRKIDALEDSLLFGGDHESITKTITDTALSYNLVSKYTSLVAVEHIIERDPLATTLASAAVPSATPYGSTMALPQGSLGIGLRLLIAVVFSLMAVLFSLATLQQVRTHE